jgi:hypothetical protein
MTEELPQHPEPGTGRYRRRVSRFWFSVLAVLILIEAFVLIAYFDAREAHSDNVNAGCRGEDCFGTGFDVVFWLFWLFAWPVLCPLLALTARWVWQRITRTAARRSLTRRGVPPAPR